MRSIGRKNSLLGRSLVPRPGRPGSLLTMKIERELTPEDILGLNVLEGDTQPLAPPPIKTLRAKHLMCARMVANGFSNQDIAITCGYTPQRISDLKKDPTFAYAVSIYEKQRTDIELEETKRIVEKLIDGGEQAWDEVLARLEDDNVRVRISTDTLLRITQLAFDRTVAPPKVAAAQGGTINEITFNIAGKILKREEVIIDNQAPNTPQILPPKEVK